MLARVDQADADIAVVEQEIEAHLAPFADAVERLAEIPGIAHTSAAVIIAEIGTDMTQFPTAGHLCSWAKYAPGIKESAGRSKGHGTTGKGNRYLARVLGAPDPAPRPTNRPSQQQHETPRLAAITSIRPSRSAREAPAWCSVTGWQRHRHHAWPHRRLRHDAKGGDF